MAHERIIVGIDPGLAHTGWGVIHQRGAALECVAYGCIATTTREPLHQRLRTIYEQMAAVVERYSPTCLGIETVWFGANVQSAFATGQARGAALAACARVPLQLAEFAPRQIKLSVVGEGSANKQQVQFMVQRLLSLEAPPAPDHAADALAAAICFATHDIAAAY